MSFFLKFIFFPGLVISILGLTGLFIASRYLYQEDFLVVFTRATQEEVKWQEAKYPSLSFVFDFIKLFHVSEPRKQFQIQSSNDLTKAIVKAPPVHFGPLPESIFVPPLPNLSAISVSTENELLKAVIQARAGDVIVLAAGEYSFKRRRISLSANGTRGYPITLRAENLGKVTLKFNMLEGFLVSGSYWTVENLIIEGGCKNESACEHAFHIVGNGHHALIRNNIVKNFNAHIKINSASKKRPNFGIIEQNVFYNEAPRETSNPVTFIDGVSTDEWVVRKNIIADFAKGQGDNVSYGAFFKGGGKNNIFEQNLVICEWLHRGGTRIGLSYGGGGSGGRYCPDNTCETEHFGGVIRNNIIMNCPRDVGIYLNKSADTLIHNNIIYNTHGIDARFKTTSAKIFNNVIDARISNRNGGFHTANNNALNFFSAMMSKGLADNIYQNPRVGNFEIKDAKKIKNQGVSSRQLGVDICNNKHAERKSDIGPFNLQNKENCQMNLEFIHDYLKD